MKRAIFALCALAVAGAFAAPALANDVDLRTPEGIKKFWQGQDSNRPSSEGSGSGN